MTFSNPVVLGVMIGRTILSIVAIKAIKNPLLRTLVVIALDVLDCVAIRIINRILGKPGNECHCNTYQQPDKLVDILVSVLLLFSLRNAVSTRDYCILAATIWYRAIGTAIYTLEPNGKFLAFFPNFFDFFAVIMLFCNQFGYQQYEDILLIGAAGFKIFQELYGHAGVFKKEKTGEPAFCCAYNREKIQ